MRIKTAKFLLPAVCAIALQGCASHDRAPSASKIVKNSALDETPTGEADIKRDTGIDYRKALQAAVRKDPAGLHQLFLFTDSGWFDGAFADDHCETLKDLLFLWGDRAFSTELSREKPRIRKAVIEALDYSGTWRNGGNPLTYAIAPHM